MKVGSQKPEVRSRKSPRRGVVLLVVLALVAIFGLIAVAFVVMTAQSRRGARSMARIGLVTDPPQKILQQAAMQVFRGPATNTSVMGAHSLLEALYGHDSISGTVAAGGASPACGGQLIAIPSGSVPAATIARRGGCVLTITSVPSGATEAQKKLVGQSSHIVGVNPDSGAFEIVRFPNG